MTYTTVITGEIGEEEAHAFINDLVEVDADDPSVDIRVILNSQGGSLYDGTAMYSMLHSLSRRGGGTHHVTTCVRGLAGSIATLLVQAGDHRVQGKQDVQIFHEPLISTDQVYVSDIQHQIDALMAGEARFLDILAERATVSRVQLADLSGPSDQYVSADDALALGLVDEIG